MLIRVGIVVSRILLAAATVLIVMASIAYLRFGAWRPISLAETLTLYRISVPDFGLPGLAQVYATLGSLPLFAYCLIIGLMCALASATAATNPTAKVFRGIVLFPLDATYYTIGSLFLVIRSFIKFTVVVIVLMITITALWAGYDYVNYAHRFSASNNCDLRQKVFGDIAFNFLYRCFDAGGTSESDDRRYYVIFMASNRLPTQSNTGHAWLALVALKKNPSGPDFLLTDYQVTGYGMQGTVPATCLPFVTSLYLAVRPVFAFAAPIEPYWCLKGLVGNEGRPPLHNPAGVPLPKPANADAVDAMLGTKPEVVLAVAVGREQFDNISHIISDQAKAPQNYQLGLHDCTTFVRDVAEAVGLYVPPRILAAFPSKSIYALMAYNLKP